MPPSDIPFLETEQLDAHFRFGDPLSVVPRECGPEENRLGIGSHRKGVGFPGDVHFIGIDALASLPIGGQIYPILPPKRHRNGNGHVLDAKSTVYSYFGVMPDQLGKLVEAGCVVPQMVCRPEDMEQDMRNVYAPVWDALRSTERFTYHVNAYEDLLLSKSQTAKDQGIHTFSDLKGRARKRLNLKEFSQDSWRAFHSCTPDMLKPKNDQELHAFVSERIAWQELHELCPENGRLLKLSRSNMQKLEDTYRRVNHPDAAYETAHTVHYAVTPLHYAKKGVSWMSHGEEARVARRVPSMRTAYANLWSAGNRGRYEDINVLAIRRPRNTAPSGKIRQAIETAVDFACGVRTASSLRKNRPRLPSVSDGLETVAQMSEDVGERLWPEYQSFIEGHNQKITRIGKKLAKASLAQLKFTQAAATALTAKEFADAIDNNGFPPSYGELPDIFFLREWCPANLQGQHHALLKESIQELKGVAFVGHDQVQIAASFTPPHQPASRP